MGAIFFLDEFQLRGGIIYWQFSLPDDVLDYYAIIKQIIPAVEFFSPTPLSPIISRCMLAMKIITVYHHGSRIPFHDKFIRLYYGSLASLPLLRSLSHTLSLYVE